MIMKYIYISLAFIFLIFVILKVTEKPDPEPIATVLKAENKENTVKVDSLLAINEELNKQLSVKDLKIDSFFTVVKKKDKQIAKLKKDEDEKLHTIDSLNADGLVELFANGIIR